MFIVITKKKIMRALTVFIILLSLLVLIYKLLHSSEIMIHHFMSEPAFSEVDWSNHFAPFQPVDNGYSVLIDLDSMTLELFEDAKAIKSWPVSGGSKENPSPTGAWSVTEIGNWGKGFGGSWIGLNVPWGKYGIHGTVEPWAVGNNNISHGCIRMKDKDVAELKQYLSAGIPVYIKYDNMPFRIIEDGKVGSDVLKLQILLKQLEYYAGTPDGIFGRETFMAVCSFQMDEQIKVDGVIGQQSWEILQERAADLDLITIE